MWIFKEFDSFSRNLVKMAFYCKFFFRPNLPKKCSIDEFEPQKDFWPNFDCQFWPKMVKKWSIYDSNPFLFFFLQTSQSFCLGVATFASIAVIGALAYAIYHVQSARKKRNSTLPRFDFAVNEFRDSEEQEIWPQTAACKFFQWN